MSKKDIIIGILRRTILYIFKGIPTKYITVNITSLPSSDWLKGRKALITGGSSGIGFEIALAYLNAGASVVITGRNELKLKEKINTLKEKTKKTDIKGIILDYSDIPSFNSKINEIEILLGGKIDILVNNAGIFNSESFGKTTEESYDHILDTNLKGPYFLSQAIALRMKENSIKGNILNIASSSSIRPANSPYTLSKWGIRGLTLGLARVLTPYDIVVNGIAPGPTATPMLIEENNKENLTHEKNLSGRYATPKEIANMAVILVSNMSRMIVGDVIYMTGGAGNVTNEDIIYKF